MEKEQHSNEPTSSSTQASLKPKSDQAEAVESMFKLRDLNRLTFKLDGVQELDAWSSTAIQFQTYVQRIVKKIDNVDTDAWTPFERLDFLNSLFTYCQKHGFRFPFFLKPVDVPVEQVEEEPTSKKA